MITMNWTNTGDSYILGEYKIVGSGRHWSLSCIDGDIGVFESLKAAKDAALYCINYMEQKSMRRAILKAFNGVVIGEYPIVYEDKYNLFIKTGIGTMKFDKRTGVQVGHQVDVFSNKIEKI